MDHGFVEMFIDKMIFYGSAGVGKTSSMSVVAGKTPPDTRDSTPIATRPVSLYQLQAMKELWLKYTPKQKMALCTQISKSILGQELLEVLDQMCMGDPTSELSDIEESDSEQTDAEESDDEPAASRSVGAGKLMTSTPTSQPHHIHEKPTPKPPPPAATPAQSLVDPQVLKVIQEVIDEIFQNIDKCPENVDPITFLHKLLIVDCGGQPQFHEVLPIFLRKMSMIVFVIKLSEELSSHPIIEYFENGKPVGTPYRSDHTTEQLIQRGLQSLHSHRSSKDKGAGSDAPKIIVIGTHKDEEHKCKESRDAKNARLREMLLPTFKREIIYFQYGTKKVLFPMNAKHPGQEEEDMAKTIRCAVTRNRQAVPTKLPLPWLGLEIVLEKVTLVLKRGVLNKSECIEIGRRLRLNESTLEAALMYLDELSLILYYPEIHVFTNPQVLLDKISELVKVHHDMLSGSGPELDTKEWRMFFDFALVMLEFLSQEVFEKHYVEGYFQPKDLVILFRKLYIFAEFSNGKYFVPCLLRMLCNEDVSKYRLTRGAVVFPLVLHFPDGSPRRGIFCSLVCFLTSPENYHAPQPMET
jgi:GTPase SAR1 family protein